MPDVEKTPFCWQRHELSDKIIVPAAGVRGKYWRNYSFRPGSGVREESDMNLDYAVDRLYEVGWVPAETGTELERLGDGRRYPTLFTVQAHFGKAGLKLSIKPNLMFNCYQATWCPAEERVDPSHDADERHGTVVGSCEREAAVYALAQLIAAQAELQLA
jgi:hypothetical protein